MILPAFLVCPPGIEPGTYSVGGCHSIQLRYGHILRCVHYTKLCKKSKEFLRFGRKFLPKRPLPL